MLNQRSRERAQRFWRGSFASILRGNLGIASLGLIAGLLLARTLAPEGRGLLAIALVWPAIAVTFVGLPGTQAVAFLAAQHPERRGDVIREALAQTIVTSGVILVLGIGGSVLIAKDDPDFLAALVIAFASTPFLLYAGVGQGVLNATNLKRWSRQRLIQPGVNAVAILAVAASGHLTLLTAALVFLASQVAAATRVWWRVLRRYRATSDSGDPSLRRQILRYGLASNLAGSAKITNARLDLATIGLFVSASQVGLYAVATSLAGYLVPLATAAAPWVFPRLARSAPTMESWLEARRAIRTSALLATAGAVVLAGLAPLLLGRVLGSEWLSALVPLWILLAAAVVQSVRHTLFSIASAYNRPGLTAQSEGIAAVVTLALLWPLVHLLGISGAALVSLIAYTTSTVLLYRGARQIARTGVPASSSEVARLPVPDPGA